MVIIQFTKFTNINNEGSEDSISYGYRIYNEEKSEYNNSFTTMEEIRNNLCKETIINYLQDFHPDFYEAIVIDGEFEFNGDTIAV